MDVATLPHVPGGHLSPGERLGPYEVRELVGSGGLGTVYRAWDGRLGREVALKVLVDNVESAAASLPELEEEARVLASLSHANILGIFDVGEDHGRRYVVTELLAGVDLRQRMGDQPLPWRTAVAIALEAAKGLAAAHASGIVHLDLKPENIFVLAQGGVKILDFGLARRVQGYAASRTPAAPTEGAGDRVVVGTLAYLSPEQIAGEPVDHRTDIFSLGGVLFEMLSGHPPFKQDDPVETLDAIVSGTSPPLAARGRTIPEGLVRIVRRCLSKDPRHRFQTAFDLAFALSEQLASPAAPAQPRLGWPVRLGYFAAGVAAALACLLLLDLL